MPPTDTDKTVPKAVPELYPPADAQNTTKNTPKITQGISAELLALLVCPKTKGKLDYDEATDELVSVEAGLAFPIEGSVPILLIDEARKID